MRQIIVLLPLLYCLQTREALRDAEEQSPKILPQINQTAISIPANETDLLHFSNIVFLSLSHKCSYMLFESLISAAGVLLIIVPICTHVHVSAVC